MERITNLTKEQEVLMSVIRDEWIRIAFDTSPVDKEKAEEAINLTYEIEGEDKPQQIIWFDNPLDAVVWILDNLDELYAVKNQTKYTSAISHYLHWSDEIIDGFFYSIHEPIDPMIEQKFAESFNQIVHRKYLDWTSNSFLSNFARHHLYYYLQNLWGEEKFLSKTSDYYCCIAHREVYAMHDIFYLALSSYYDAIGINCPEFKGYWEAAKHCGLWWTFVDVAVVIPKPSVMNLDGEYRLYAEGKPALVYPGFEYYYPRKK